MMGMKKMNFQKKTIIVYVRTIILAKLSVLLFISNVYSQGTDSRTNLSKQKRIYVGINMNPALSSIPSKKVENISSLNSTGKMTLNGLVDFGYFFSPIAGISLGAGLNSYSQVLTLSAWETRFQCTDSENESYEMQIHGNSIMEQQKISNLVFPLCLNLRLQITEKIGFFIKPGFQIEIPLVRKFKGSGVFTYDGYYSAYPILLQDLPEYGFPRDVSTIVSGDLEVKSLNFSMVAVGGLSMNIGGNIQLVMFTNYSSSLSNISANELNTGYRLSSQAYEFRSMMEGSSKPAIKSFGFGIGLRYLLD